MSQLRAKAYVIISILLMLRLSHGTQCMESDLKDNRPDLACCDTNSSGAEQCVYTSQCNDLGVCC